MSHERTKTLYLLGICILIISAYHARNPFKRKPPFLPTKDYGILRDPYEAVEIDTELQMENGCTKSMLSHYDPRGRIESYYQYNYDEFDNLKSRYSFDHRGLSQSYSKFGRKYRISQGQDVPPEDRQNYFFDSSKDEYFKELDIYQSYFDEEGELEGRADQIYTKFHDKRKIDKEYIYDNRGEIFHFLNYFYDFRGLLLYKLLYDYRDRLQWRESYFYDKKNRLDEVYRHDGEGHLSTYRNMSQEDLQRWLDSLHNSFLHKFSGYKKYHYDELTGQRDRIESFNKFGSLNFMIKFDYDEFGNLHKKSIFDGKGDMLQYIQANYDCESITNQLPSSFPTSFPPNLSDKMRIPSDLPTNLDDLEGKLKNQIPSDLPTNLDDVKGKLKNQIPSDLPTNLDDVKSKLKNQIPSDLPTNLDDVKGKLKNQIPSDLPTNLDDVKGKLKNQIPSDLPTNLDDVKGKLKNQIPSDLPTNLDDVKRKLKNQIPSDLPTNLDDVKGKLKNQIPDGVPKNLDDIKGKLKNQIPTDLDNTKNKLKNEIHKQVPNPF